MEKVLKFLHGKKTTISSIIFAITQFCVGRGYIQQDLAESISVIMIIIGAGDIYSTKKLQNKLKKP